MPKAVRFAVDELGPDVPDLAAGDEMIGFTNNRASQAEFVRVAADDLTPRPRESPGRSQVRCSSRVRRPGPRRERSGPSPATLSSSPPPRAGSDRSPCSSSGEPQCVNRLPPIGGTLVDRAGRDAVGLGCRRGLHGGADLGRTAAVPVRAGPRHV
jgi:hypothetical protein